MISPEFSTNPESHQGILDSITLLPLQGSVTAESLRRNPSFVDRQPILAVDFPVSSENNIQILNKSGELCGFEDQELGVACIDLHADDTRMYRYVSATPLICSIVQDFGLPTRFGYRIAINYTDADSVLSAFIACGLCDANDPRFSEAAMAADHTGKENFIGDILNGIEDKRDVSFSWQSLKAALEGTALPLEAQKGLEKRKRDREYTLNAVQKGCFIQAFPGVYIYQAQEGESLMRTEYVCGAISDARVILTAAKSRYGEGFDYKARVGLDWPAGKSIQSLGLPQFGGRWNAGGTVRSLRAVNMSPKEYAKLISDGLLALK